MVSDGVSSILPSDCNIDINQVSSPYTTARRSTHSFGSTAAKPTPKERFVCMRSNTCDTRRHGRRPVTVPPSESI